MTLSELAVKYGTDKAEHGYMPFYEKHLPTNPKRILEIGVKQGASMAMWAEYFPNASIHGLDLFSEFSLEEVKNFVDQACSPKQEMHLWEGDQRDWKILEELRKYDFDVIIDDGSHGTRHQLITFFGLFNGKHYFIEDLHCNDEPQFYAEGLPYSFATKNLFDGGIFGADNKIILINAL